MRFAEAESEVVAGRAPNVIVTLWCPGFTVRAAFRPLSITDDDGDGPYFYDATLLECDDMAPEVDLFGLERGEITQARVSLVLPRGLAGTAESDSGARLEADMWQHLAASRCEVATIWEGQVWKDRTVWIGRGAISGLELGIAGEPIRFVAEALAQAAAAMVGDPSREVSDEGQLLGDFGDIRGIEYPWVIGKCYRIPVIKVGTLGPGASDGVLAGHTFHHTTLVTVYEDSNSTAYTPTGVLSVVNSTNAEGDDVCYLSSTSTVDMDDNAGVTGSGAFTFDAKFGGVQAARGGGAAITASGVLAWLLTRSGAAVDWRRMQFALDKLVGWEIGVYNDTATDALEVIRERLLPYLPLIEEDGPSGIWYRYADPFGDESVADLIVGQNLVGPTSNFQQVTDPDDLRNRITVKYFYDHYLGEYLETVTVDDTNNAMCAVSKQLYGVRDHATLECNTTWDVVTATRMAHHRMNRLALPRFARQYIAAPELYWLAEGMTAKLTDDQYGISARRVAVRKVRATMNPPTVTLELVPGLATSVGA